MSNATAEQHAVNIADLTKDSVMAHLVVKPVCPNRVIVNCEPGRFDGAAVVLECGDEQARRTVAVIRLNWQTNLFRCYCGSGKTWKRE